MKLQKIISGGQTGADRGGLLVGKILGIPTGGTAPQGWITEQGPYPALGHTYGLVEGPPGYPERTRLNVVDSDGTLIVGNIHSPGSQMTLSTCIAEGKPHIVNPVAPLLVAWLTAHDIKILNVAGNRESKNPGIREQVILLLQEALCTI